MKLKTCKVCKIKFEPSKPLQSVCGFKCAIEDAENKRDEALAKQKINVHKAVKTRLNELKTRSDWIKEVQIAFNAWRRESELKKGEGCISCGTHNGKMNCGHYRSTKACPELRFEPLNAWLQCEKCNTWLSGNLILYRQALVKKGIDVDWLEGSHPPKKYAIDELKALKEEFKLKLKEIKK